ncbi:MAG: GNAT family N-acetyltransferase [Chloroflexota bacterium]
MIRHLTAEDRAQTVAFLQKSRPYNLYMLGNIESLGMVHELSEFWGDWNTSDRAQEAQNHKPKLRAVLNRYMNGWTIYGDVDADWVGLAAIIDSHDVDAKRLQDNPNGVESILPYIQQYQATSVKEETLMALGAQDFQPQKFSPSKPATGISNDQTMIVRRATMSDLPRLIEFYADAGHMTRTSKAIERPLRDTRLWIAALLKTKECNQPSEAATSDDNCKEITIVSAALSNAETTELAMIGGVYTHPNWRGLGLSQSVCSALCDELFTLGKQPVLYWDTPEEGAVYRRLGFHLVGQWRSVWLERTDR